MVSGVVFGEADTCMLYVLMFNCGGDGWYVMCAKSVADTKTVKINFSHGATRWLVY